MAHPFNEHRAHKHEKARVSHIVGSYASGGAVHSDEAEDRKMVKSMVRGSALKADGKKAKHRADRVSRTKRDRGGGVTRLGVGATQPMGNAASSYVGGGDQEVAKRASGGSVKKSGKTIVNVNV